jgi:hypothetical protein
MPGPLPSYRSNAERQRAYRQRLAAEATADLEDARLILSYAYALQQSLRQARKAGSTDPLLPEVEREDPIEILRALADHFYDQAGVPTTERPWLGGSGTKRLTPRCELNSGKGEPLRNP